MSLAIYFDCFSGISGDMALGALLDAGLSLDALCAELNKLGIEGWSLTADRSMRRYLAGTRALVHAPEQATHRHLSDVHTIIEASTLAPEIKSRSLRIFTLLAEAEGRIHGISANAVHFHEVGALDAIVDIVGVVTGLDLLGIDEVYASPLPLGSGWVRAAHGMLPIPAPAVLALLAAANAPTLPDNTQAELVTPTGAAILAALATFSRPAMHIERIGYGLGARDLERPNALRVWVGSTEATHATDQQHNHVNHSHANGHTHYHDTEAHHTNNHQAAPATPPILLETNIDDQPAEQLAYTIEQLFALGALDAWLTPITMKKGRLGTLVAALVPTELEDAAVALIMRETTTLGVRRRAVERYTCEREFVQVETGIGWVRTKRKRWHGEDLGAAPEYEDCARLAREHNIALREVYRLASK